MKPHWSVAGIYLLFGVIWILVTDYLMERLAAGTEMLTALQTMKGFVFVVLSALLVWVLTKREHAAREAAEQEKFAVFQKTVEGAHHILLNYVNQMQILTIAAEQCADFDQSALATADEISGKVVVALDRLNRIARVTSDEIDAAIYEDLRKPVIPQNTDLSM